MLRPFLRTAFGQNGIPEPRAEQKNKSKEKTAHLGELAELSSYPRR